MHITSIIAEPLHLELHEPFRISTGVQPRGDNVLVRLTLENGIVGLGEAAPVPHIMNETADATMTTIRDAEQLIKGNDVRRWRSLAEELKRAYPQMGAARAAIEMAMLDALGQLHRIPLWCLFGGKLDRLYTDMTITAGDMAHAERSAIAIQKRGIRTIKIKIGAVSVEEDIERLVAIHRAVPTLRLFVDANGAHTVDQAQRFCVAMKDHRIAIALFEQPFARGTDAKLWHELHRAAPEIPLCADEDCHFALDVLRIVETRSAQYINIKLTKCGIVESLAMWHIAKSAGLGLMIGGMVESILAMSCSAHFAAGLGGFDFVDLDTPMFITNSPFEGGFIQRVDELCVELLDAGHGVRLPSAK